MTSINQTRKLVEFFCTHTHTRRVAQINRKFPCDTTGENEDPWCLNARYQTEKKNKCTDAGKYTPKWKSECELLSMRKWVHE